MFTLCRLTDFRNEKHPHQVVRERLEAKVALWEFLYESIGELLAAYEGEDRVREIIGTVIWTLHPAYEGVELVEETRLVLLSLKLPVPAGYIGLFTQAFTRIVAKKIKAIIENRKRNDNG